MREHKFKDQLKIELRKLASKNLLRDMVEISSPQGSNVSIMGRNFLLFCSNNYLGLANHPDIIRASIEYAKRYGVGSGASRLISGTMTPHVELEEKLKKFLSAEKTLLFNSGYHANVGTISAIAQEGDTIFSDELNHASIIDGCRLSKAKCIIYPHRNVEVLENLMKKERKRNGKGKSIIVSESLFSMDGNIAPIVELVALKKRFGAVLILDEAHAFGVIGKGGKGVAEQNGVEREVDIKIGTLGKAFGCFGAFVVSDATTINFLMNKARSFIYTTSLPPPIVGAAIKAISLAEEAEDKRIQIRKNIEQIRGALSNLNGIKVENHIFTIIFGSSKQALMQAWKLFEKGIFAQSIRPPTVKPGTARIRFSITSEHKEEDIYFLTQSLFSIFN
ncbi:MAG: 8-amino-7-oxononanoate synthase [Acidobacteriota bacterium]